MRAGRATRGATIEYANLVLGGKGRVVRARQARWCNDESSAFISRRYWVVEASNPISAYTK